MDAVTEPVVAVKPRRWRREQLVQVGEGAVLALAIAVPVATYIYVRNYAQAQLFSPGVAGLLLLVNLLPYLALIALIGRRIAIRRAAKLTLGGRGRLHTRLVAVFTLMASIPIVLTVLAASVMFQSGVQLWGSERARAALDSTMALAKEGQQLVIDRWTGEASTMSEDMAERFPTIPSQSPEFQTWFLYQTYVRSFYQSVLFRVVDGKNVEAMYGYEAPEADVFKRRVTGQVLNLLRDQDVYVNYDSELLWVVKPIDRSRSIFLYLATPVNIDFLNKQNRAADSIVAEYGALQKRARLLQFQFNAILFGVALLIVGLATAIALAVADRLVRPLDQLVRAAGQVAEGDLAARVPPPQVEDEIGTLGVAFNSMTERLQAQTGALMSANTQLESRRALIEAVMSGVSAGVISIDAGRNVRLINESAAELLRQDAAGAVGQPLSEIMPELDTLLDGEAREAVVQVTVGGEARTLAVKITRDEGGQVLTFDDITQQLLDQRRAAWSDVARRIAHEIKNPLTPIQLAAERLQRKYGKANEGEKDGTFARLTDTIVRQVGDLRRIVDEFSSFARMPKPLFRQESLLDIARQSMFLHEVAHPAIRFEMDAADATPIVCDRRQIGQALTNVVKNAVEAIEGRAEGKKKLPPGEIVLTIRQEDRRVILSVADNGVGLPLERDRIAEPYMTTRERGTGLGLAIVKKIIETEQLAGMASEAGPGDDSEPRPAALTRTGTKA